MGKLVEVGETFCKLCGNIVNGENFRVIGETIKNVLDVLLLKLNILETNQHVLCNACFLKLQAAFEFKATCTDTEDCIFPYVHSDSGYPVDLIEIYLKERGKEHLRYILEDERICRLCLEIVTCGFTPVKEINVDILRKYIPEVNFKSTEEPVICKGCIDSLNTHMSFLNNCLNAEEIIDDKCGDKAIGSRSSVKYEDVEIKCESNEVGNASFDVSEEGLVDCATEHNIKDTKTAVWESDFIKHRLKHKDSSEDKVCNLDHEDNEIKPNHLAGNSPELKIYTCEDCGYKGTQKLQLLLHQLTHRECPELPTYKCEKCDYKTQRKNNFKKHQLVHKNFSEVPTYKCDRCDFQTKRQHTLRYHQLTHKNSSERPRYKCDICGLETMYKQCFSKHLAIHKERTQVSLYKCEQCNFETIHKSSIRRHMETRHKNPSDLEKYKCEACDYVTVYKPYLTRHKQKKHQNCKDTSVSLVARRAN